MAAGKIQMLRSLIQTVSKAGEPVIMAENDGVAHLMMRLGEPKKFHYSTR